MKLSKAKELSEIYAHHPLNNMTPDEKTAHQLGIEALKRVEITREQHLFQCWILLPGEDGYKPPTPTEDEKQRLQESPLGTIY